jgi:hypothetical protein
MCGGTIEFEPGATVGVCDSCGTKQTLPRLDDDKKVNLYDRANHFRRNNDYDKAMSIYEQVLNEDNTDAEAYWSLVLCRYGIEYVEDPATHKRIPTVNRTQFTSIFADEDYRSAIQYADGYQKVIYEEEAKAIDEIQKGILAISQKEEPFDVFICYKETDANGRRTQDSVLANDLYHQLTQEGFKVFFSRITLEDKLGTAYEPYIFAALNSSKVMVVLGTRPEYFNAVWVKNEWSRYLALIKNGAKKTLVPAYRDMDPYDLPEEFSHLQAQDMSKLGFMQDLIRGIKKIIGASAPKEPVKEPVVVGGGAVNIAPLLKRVFMFLEDGNWRDADEYCEKVLDQDPENPQAYLGKLMAELKVRKQDDLQNCEKPFDGSNYYQKALRFANQTLADQLKGYISYINQRNETACLYDIYTNATHEMQKANTESSYRSAAAIFQTISGFLDADTLAEQCLEQAEIRQKDAIYNSAKRSTAGGSITSYESAISTFQTIPGWRDTDEQIAICKKKIEELEAKAEKRRLEVEKNAKKIRRIVAVAAPVMCVCIMFCIILKAVIIPQLQYRSQYKSAEALLADDQIAEAAITFGNIANYSDAYDRSLDLWDQFAVRNSLATGSHYIVGLKTDSTVVADGDNELGQCDVADWTNIVAVSASHHTVGLKADKTVVAVGINWDGQCDVSDWTDIVEISAGSSYTVGLKSDGTVVAVGNNKSGQCNVSEWTDIVAISASTYHTVGLKSDGTVVAVGNNKSGQCDVSDWTDIVAISTGVNYTVGLKSDGTVVAVGNNKDNQCDVIDWTDIIAISTGSSHTVGLKSDGTVVAVGNNENGQCDVSNWTDIAEIDAYYIDTVGLKTDGTVVAVGYDNSSGRYNVDDWTDIKVPD